jgi:hypothetical protein
VALGAVAADQVALGTVAADQVALGAVAAVRGFQLSKHNGAEDIQAAASGSLVVLYLEYHMSTPYIPPPPRPPSPLPPLV